MSSVKCIRLSGNGPEVTLLTKTTISAISLLSQSHRSVAFSRPTFCSVPGHAGGSFARRRIDARVFSFSLVVPPRAVSRKSCRSLCFGKLPAEESLVCSVPNERFSLNHVFVYTDGSCLGNPGPGGSGYLVVHGSCGRHDSDSEQNTTKNRMELRAAIEALNSLPDACTVTLFSDRRYLITGMSTLVPRWQERACRSSNGTVQNQALWHELLRADGTSPTHLALGSRPRWYPGTRKGRPAGP